MNLEAVDKWHKTKLGYVVFGLVELGLAYLLFSLAIDSGQLWEYAVGFLFIYGGGSNLVKSFRTRTHEHRAKR